MSSEDESPLFRILLFVLFLAGAGGGGSVGSAVIGERTGLLIGAGLGLMLAGAVYYLIARPLNSTAGPDGRNWHNLHTISGIPAQRFAALNPALGVGALAGALGTVTAGWLGCLLFMVVVVAAIVLYTRTLRQRRQDELAARRDYAAAHGYLYHDRHLTLLGERWEQLYPRRTATLQPFGVLAGETDGLPWTVFDTEQLAVDGRRAGLPSTERLRQSVFVVHLPTAYPRLRLTHEQHSTLMSPAKRREIPRTATLEADPSQDGLVRAATDAGVIAATISHGLPDWWIEGSDLITARPAPAENRPLTPEELTATLTPLVALAGLFSTTPLTGFGTPATAGVPLRPAT